MEETLVRPRAPLARYLARPAMRYLPCPAMRYLPRPATRRPLRPLRANRPHGHADDEGLLAAPLPCFRGCGTLASALAYTIAY